MEEVPPAVPPLSPARVEDVPPAEPPANGGTAAPVEVTVVPLLGTKRQRRPSVRLGEIGDQPAAIPSDPHARRPKHWRLPPSAPRDHAKPRPYHHASAHRQPSKTRHLTNIAPGGDEGADVLAPAAPSLGDDGILLAADENLDPLGAGVRRAGRDTKPWRGARRVRSSWVVKADEGMEGAEFKTGIGVDAADEGFPEGSGSPAERNDRRTASRVRVSDSRDAGPALDGEIPSETDGGDWNDRDMLWRAGEDGGVRSWLDGLGLGRYAPVFEIHEVDDEVLPLLTLEDLRDMGINAVGSRRKMFCAIQRLRKNMD